ncbi:polyamine-modulated factor 1 [Kryptolebias marmoratus]|uniref:polyamine-modulated factor 1 n=1 Tax=Kryptolebias marmoratus TaxID=37003 RepID=UPI0007F87BDD|nr:polyamine-modulated factor 1 [Kryptolebias marmoratus]
MEEGSVSAKIETAEERNGSGPSDEQTAEEVASERQSAGNPTEEAKARYNRLKLFDKVLEKSLNKFMEQAGFKGFSSTFRPLYKKNPQLMESIHKQFAEELRKTIQEDITKLIEEGMLECKLNEMDKLENAAKDDPEPAWRPSGSPEQDFCSYLTPYYQKQEAYVRLELKKIRAENAALAEKVRAGRESVAQTELRISAAVEDWKASVTEFEQVASSFHPADVFDV